jgi:hypothetical protein
VLRQPEDQVGQENRDGDCDEEITQIGSEARKACEKRVSTNWGLVNLAAA